MVIRSCQHGFTKGNSYLTNLINFQEVISGLMNEGSTLESNTFHTVSLKILTEKLMNYGLYLQPVIWIDIKLEEMTDDPEGCCPEGSQQTREMG